jgi:hypothetical protein
MVWYCCVTYVGTTLHTLKSYLVGPELYLGAAVYCLYQGLPGLLSEVLVYHKLVPLCSKVPNRNLNYFVSRRTTATENFIPKYKYK